MYHHDYLIQNTKTMYEKPSLLDIYSSNLISVNLMTFKWWPVTSDLTKHDFYGLLFSYYGFDSRFKPQIVSHKDKQPKA